MEPQPDSTFRDLGDAGVCPKCGSGYAQRSHRRGWKDRAASWFGMRPYRCWQCHRRFYLRLPDATSHRGGAK